MTHKQYEQSAQLATAFMNAFVTVDEKTKNAISLDTPVQRKMAKVMKSFQNWATEYNDEVDNIRLKLCLKGEKGEILKDSTGYLFDENGTIELKKKIKEFNKSECKDVIRKVDWDVFSADEKAFKGFDLEDEETVALMEIFINGLEPAL